MSGTRRKDGPLGPFVDGFGARLLALGYTPGSTRGKLREVGQLGRWMAVGGVSIDWLDAASPFDRIVGHLAFHDAGVGASTSGWEQLVEQLRGGLFMGGAECCGGKSRDATRWCGVRPVGCG